MKAAIYTQYGSPDVLQLRDVDKPVPKDTEVLIRVHATSINDWDWGLLNGDAVNRLINGIFKPKKMNILGSDIAGRVEAVGKAVTCFKPGDDVYGDLAGRFGGFADYVCALQNQVAKMAIGMSFEQAAAIPQAGMLALQGLFDILPLKDGQKVLINGAGGGVGTFGIQFAKQFDVEVTGVDSTGKLELMRRIGFDHVIDYTQEDFTQSGREYDLIVDAKTNRSSFVYLRALKPSGVYATVGGRVPRLLQVALFGKPIQWLTGKQTRIIVLRANRDLAYINELFEAGKLTPVIDGPYTLNQLADAFRHFGRAEHQGKIVVTIPA
ncbi:NAD(P)-dependent alcohol dehydrogenase [Microbulbifer sp. 2304DJ12-6]|uniref:NAD(P)-dependent alcohol dehydrogenase n=1 Tax=Microbulbifer sp. 2304DJ12-6 TaxID=3233340 RepID=UPI0039B116D9